MRWYHVGMTLVDLAFLYNLHFWTGYSIAAFIDQALPAPPTKRGMQEGRILGEMVGQLTALGYVIVLLVPILGQLWNPMWRLVKEQRKSNEPFKPYQATAAAGMLESTFLMLGIMCGSPNFVRKTQLLNHPELN